MDGVTMTNTAITSSDELIRRAIDIAAEGRCKRVAVAAAQDVDVIDAVAQAQAEGFVSGILVGDEAEIQKLAAEHGTAIDGLEIVDKPDIGEAAGYAVGLAAEKKADAIMKGFLPTSALLKTVLDSRYGLRGKNTLSHCAVMDIPGYDRLLNVTDGGMVVKPDLETKLQILENAILVGRALGLSPVRVAVSGAVDQPREDMPHTISDAEQLVPMARQRFEDIEIQSPVPFDAATAEPPGRQGEVVGRADIFLVDSIEECNIVCKALIQFARAVFAGVIVGAGVPVSLVSRTDTVKNKKTALALACVIADCYDRSR